MGRGKLQMVLRENRRARLTTYFKRMKVAQKKALELSILCGIDVLLVTYSPDLNAVHCWPEDPAEFGRVAARYRISATERRHLEKACGITGGIQRPCFATSASPTLQEELASIDRKLEEARKRLRLLEGGREGCSTESES